MAKILIVDDEPFMVEMLQTFLGINGYETVGAYSGQDGIVLSQIESPDAMILDLMLPDIEGFEVCRALRSISVTERVPVLILSARTTQADKDRAMSAGANGYLTKPVRMAELLGELRRVIEKIPVTPPTTTTIRNSSPNLPPSEGSSSVASG